MKLRSAGTCSDNPSAQRGLAHLPPELFEDIWRRLDPEDLNYKEEEEEEVHSPNVAAHALRCTCMATRDASDGLISKLVVDLCIEPEEEGEEGEALDEEDAVTAPLPPLLQRGLEAIDCFPQRCTLKSLVLQLALDEVANESELLPKLMTTAMGRLGAVTELHITAPANPCCQHGITVRSRTAVLHATTTNSNCPASSAD